MKIILALIISLLLCFNLAAQTEKKDSPEVGVEELSMARDDGSGKAGEVTAKFRAADVPLHCIVRLISDKPVNVKMNIVAVKADGYKPGTNVIAVSYTTKENQNRVTFNASPEKVWAAGDYRVDILLNGKITGSLSFEIEKQSPDVKEKTTFAPNNKPRKRKPKP